MGSCRNQHHDQPHIVTSADEFVPYAESLTLCTTGATSSCSTSHQSPAAGLPPAAAASSSARRASSAARRFAVCLRVAAFAVRVSQV